MGTLTLNAKVDLTYEEIYEGYANGKSRLPKIIKDIENGEVALAESTGVNILRRRTLGGDSTNVINIGQTDTNVVAQLISAARFDALIAAYTGPGGGFVTPPSYNLQTVDVRAVIKNPFDLIDQVAGVNFARQESGSAENTKTGREAKLQELGTGVRTRGIDVRAPAGATADIDVRDSFANDRIGSGGATGEVHGVDQGISDTVLVADSEGRAVGAIAATFNTSIAGSTGLSFKLGATGSPVIDVTFPLDAALTIEEARDTINAAVAAAQVANPGASEFEGIPVNDPVAIIIGGAIELHSRNRGLAGESGFLITTDNTQLGFTTADNVASGATAGDVDGIFEQTVVDLDPTASSTRTTLRYSTAQFGVLQIVGTTNGLVAATASAYIVHPDFLEDLINF